MENGYFGCHMINKRVIFTVMAKYIVCCGKFVRKAVIGILAKRHIGCYCKIITLTLMAKESYPFPLNGNILIVIVKGLFWLSWQNMSYLLVLYLFVWQRNCITYGSNWLEGWKCYIAYHEIFVALIVTAKGSYWLSWLKGDKGIGGIQLLCTFFPLVLLTIVRNICLLIPFVPPLWLTIGLFSYVVFNCVVSHNSD